MTDREYEAIVMAIHVCALVVACAYLLYVLTEGME